MTRAWKRPIVWIAAAASITAGSVALLIAQQPPAGGLNQIAIDRDDIGGIVTSRMGPEAGVWVIAETTELPTTLRRIVVTDDRGRFVLPDLPNATYKVWVRGYGLIDSAATTSKPGQRLSLSAMPAPNPKAAAQIYPASYWLSLLSVPPKAAFPMPPPPSTLGRNGPPLPGVKTQADWAASVKFCAGGCHQMGTQITREINPAMGTFESSLAAWDHRVRMGQVGSTMLAPINALGRERSLALWADWTDRIAAGELPPTPPRPTGVERNLVLTIWDWARPITFMHDVYLTDKRNPTLNPYGPVYGTDYNEGIMAILDPVKNTTEVIQVPTIDDKNFMNGNRSTMAARFMEFPSLYWGEELIYDEIGRTEVKNVDGKGRVWMMTGFRAAENQPAYCKPASGNKFAVVHPLDKPNRRQMAMFDPKTRKFTFLDTCFETHHATFGEDKDDTYYVTGQGGALLSWMKLRIFDETGDVEKAQGWCPAFYDTNNSGKYERGVDRLDTSPMGYYSTFNSKDGSVWFTLPGTPGKIVRMVTGTNPPETCKSEIYEPPFYNAKAPDKLGYLPRGIDSDRNGLIWTGLAGSGQLASFDRSKCPNVTGPAAMEGQRCLEGWTLYPLPGPNLKGLDEGGSSDFIYGNWVDQFDTLGLGKNVPLVNGTNSDSIMALMPDTKKWVVLRVPYPLGFFTRNMTGRIDDANAGWKGRGLWAGNEARTPWHIEGGKGTTPHVVHFQMRPDPLAH